LSSPDSKPACKRQKQSQDSDSGEDFATDEDKEVSAKPRSVPDLVTPASTAMESDDDFMSVASSHDDFLGTQGSDDESLGDGESMIYLSKRRGWVTDLRIIRFWR
jgi:ariadne-1